MSRLLLDEQPLLIMPKLATKIGLNESIVLQQIHYWNETINKPAKNNYKDGYYWTFNTYEGWQEQFPFWSVSTVKRILTNLEKMKLVVSGNYNKLKIDRTKWYRIDYDVLEFLENSPLGQIDLTNISKWYEELTKMNRPLPETNTETKTKTTKNNKGAKQSFTRALSFEDIKIKYSINTVVAECIEYYLSLYQENRGSEHPRLKEEQWEYVINYLFTVDDMDVDETALMDMMEAHFLTTYQNCDYNIMHFMSDGVKRNRMFEVAYYG